MSHQIPPAALPGSVLACARSSSCSLFSPCACRRGSYLPADGPGSRPWPSSRRGRTPLHRLRSRQVAPGNPLPRPLGGRRRALDPLSPCTAFHRSLQPQTSRSPRTYQATAGVAERPKILYLWVVRAVRTSQAVPVSRDNKQEKVSIAHRLRRSDVLLFLTAVALGGIGVLAIYVAEADYRQLYAVNQTLGLVVGLVGAVVLALLDYRWLGRHLRFVYGATIVMLVVVLVAGFSVNGGEGRVGGGPRGGPPSEFAKPLSIVVLAGYVAANSFARNMTL